MTFKMTEFSGFKQKEETTEKEGLSEYEQAFAAARKAGKKTFEFEGKLHNTALEGEGIMFHKGGTTYVQGAGGEQRQYRFGAGQSKKVKGDDGIYRYE